MTKLAKETIHKPFDFNLSEVAAGAEFKPHLPKDIDMVYTISKSLISPSYHRAHKGPHTLKGRNSL